MMKRLLVGVIEGSIVGAALALALERTGLQGSPIAAYGAAAMTGIGDGLVAGNPIWRAGAKTEAGLKAIVGAFIAVTCLFGLRKWLPSVSADLSAFGAGRGAIGNLPLIALPLIGSALALVFEIDDAFGADPEAAVRRRVDRNSSARDASSADSEETSSAESPRRSAGREG